MRIARGQAKTDPEFFFWPRPIRILHVGMHVHRISWGPSVRNFPFGKTDQRILRGKRIHDVCCGRNPLRFLGGTNWRHGVIAELIMIVTGIDFCFPDLLRLLWGLS